MKIQVVACLSTRSNCKGGAIKELVERDLGAHNAPNERCRNRRRGRRQPRRHTPTTRRGECEGRMGRHSEADGHPSRCTTPRTSSPTEDVPVPRKDRDMRHGFVQARQVSAEMNEMWVEVIFGSSSSTASGWELRISNPSKEHLDHMFEEGWCHCLARHHCNYSYVYSKRYYDAYVFPSLPHELGTVSNVKRPLVMLVLGTVLAESGRILRGRPSSSGPAGARRIPLAGGVALISRPVRSPDSAFQAIFATCSGRRRSASIC
jgi:hypothetical protein